MLLAIDCGNTNIVFGIFDNGALRTKLRLETNILRSGGKVSSLLQPWLDGEGVELCRIKGVVLAIVLPDLLDRLREEIVQEFDCKILVVGHPGTILGISIDVDEPRDVGADRLVNAVAASEMYPQPIVVVDFGTATTFDVIDKKGNYCGGVIAPGVNLSLDALCRAAAQLPPISVEKPPQVIGGDTISAMQSGIFWGYTGLIEGVIKRIQSEMGAETTVIATGGLAHLYAASTEILTYVEPDLTLHGLSLVWERNQ